MQFYKSVYKMAAKIIFLYEFNEEKCPLVEEMELPFYKIIYKVVLQAKRLSEKVPTK